MHISKMTLSQICRGRKKKKEKTVQKSGEIEVAVMVVGEVSNVIYSQACCLCMTARIQKP